MAIRGAVGIIPYVASQDKAVASYYFPFAWIPYDELAAWWIHSVKLVAVTVFACASSGIAESQLAQPSYLTHCVGGGAGFYYVYFVVALIGVPQAAFLGQLGLKQRTVYGCYYGGHVSILLGSKISK